MRLILGLILLSALSQAHAEQVAEDCQLATSTFHTCVDKFFAAKIESSIGEVIVDTELTKEAFASCEAEKDEYLSCGQTNKTRRAVVFVGQKISALKK